MALGSLSEQNQVLVSVTSLDSKRVFSANAIIDQFVRMPSQFHVLPDVRPPSDHARAQALEGRPPKSANNSRFDPLKGPFSLEGASTNAWLQSLDFLRDIKSATKGSTQLSPVWLEDWLKYLALHPEKSGSPFLSGASASTKTQRLIWRTRRILNCLSHALPIVSYLSPKLQTAFWSALVSDIAKIGAPTATLWASLNESFDPLSPRAVWLRAIAILAVDAAFSGILRQELLDNAVETVKSSIQKDGLMKGGSIIGTLSAGADLCMIMPHPALEPVLAAVRQALGSLRRVDGTLVTFGIGDSNYAQLLSGVIGRGDCKPSALLLESGIARMAAKDTHVWMRAPQSNKSLGPTCEIEVGGSVLLSSNAPNPSAMVFNAVANVQQGRCKRRDEPDCAVLEANATLSLAGRLYSCIRQIRLLHNGREIAGEDILTQTSARTAGHVQDFGVKEISFSLPQSSICFLSKDHRSVLIVTSEQQAWRFRIEGMDISVQMGSDSPERGGRTSVQRTIVCRSQGKNSNSEFKAVWKLVLED